MVHRGNRGDCWWLCKARGSRWERKDLEEFVTEEKSLADFADFRGRLTGLTTTVKKYFTTMVTELEEGLPGVGSEVVRAVSLEATPAEEEPPKLLRRSARLA